MADSDNNYLGCYFLAWFFSGQKPEPSVLPSEQNPVYFEASVTRETTVVLKDISLKPGG